MTDNEESSPSLNERLPLHLEITDTSFINATLLDTSLSSSALESSLLNNNAAAISPTITFVKPLPGDRKILATKKRRKRDDKENDSLTGISAGDSSVTGSAKTSNNGLATGNINSASPSLAKISDDFTTCSFFLDNSNSPPGDINDNDNTDGQNESFGAEHLSCSMLSGTSDMDIGDISDKIQELELKNVEKDRRIEEMAQILEIAIKQKEQLERGCSRAAADSEMVEDKFSKVTLCRNPQLHESSREGESFFNPFEESSYLKHPDERSLVICAPEMFQKETQTCQTDKVASKSIGINCSISTLAPSLVQKKCQDLQQSTQIMRSEVASLKSFVTNHFKSSDGTNNEDVVRAITLFFNKQSADLMSLKAQYSKDIDYQNNVQIELREELNVLKLSHENSLKEKNNEIRTVNEELSVLKFSHEKSLEEKNNEIQAVNEELNIRKLSYENSLEQKNNHIRAANEDLNVVNFSHEKSLEEKNNEIRTVKEELDILKLSYEKSLEEKNTEIQTLNEELVNLNDKSKEYKIHQETEIQTVQLTNEGIIKNKNDEIRALTAKNSRLEETVKNFNIDKKIEIDQVKLRSEERLKSKSEELRSLRQKVSHLEEAKRNERKLSSFSSRLSPEGSELEGDASIADSTSGAESHYRLTRTKIDYLKLTPPVECIDDGEHFEQSSSSDIPNSVVEDLKLQLLDMEKKYDANRKYLDEQTIEREQERDEYHRTIEDYHIKNEEYRKENDRLMITIANQKLEVSDYDTRLKDSVETEKDLTKKCERAEEELKAAVDKIFELREIIRDLEEQIDSATVNAIELKDQNQLLSEELDRLEGLKRDQDDAMQTTQDTVLTLGSDMVEELQAQLGDITRRLEKKLNEMDNFPWQTRPNSSCSGAISVSTEDVSVREFSYLNHDKDCDPREAGPLLCDGLRRLDTHFENFVRFQEIIVKKLQDADLRASHAKKRIEDLENEKCVYQDNARSQINTIADLESRLDQFRFEPSPSTVTLSGLRARVSALTEECEQYKGNLELRNIELQDAISRQTATQAMFEKYKSMTAQNATSLARKSSVQTQSQRNNMNNSFTQTDKTSAPTAEACVQTTDIAKSNYKFEYFNRPSFELSTIPGGPAPTFSTPNEIVSLQKSAIKNKNLANAWSFLDGDGGGDSEIFSRTPETVRNRVQQSLLALSGERSVERLSNKSVSFSIKALEHGTGDRDPGPGYELDDTEDMSLFTVKPKPGEARLLDTEKSKPKPTSSGPSGVKDNENARPKPEDRNGANDGQGSSQNGVNPPNNAFIGTIGSNRKNSKNNDVDNSLPSNQNRRVSKSQDDQRRNSKEPENNVLGSNGGSNNDDFRRPQDDDVDRDLDDGFSNYEDDIHSDSSLDERQKNAKQKRSLDPNIGLDSSDDERMNAEGRRRSGSRDQRQISGGPERNVVAENSQRRSRDDDYLIENSKDEQIKKMMARINELEDIIKADKPDDQDYDKYLLETEIEFDKNGVPIKGNSALRDGLGDAGSILSGDLLGTKEIQELIDRIEGEGLDSLTDEEKNKLIRALKERVARGPGAQISGPVSRTGETESAETFSYEVQAVTDYAVDNEGRRHIINTDLFTPQNPDQQMKRVPDASDAQRERIAETDRQVEIEALKTQIDQLQQALQQEKLKCQELAEMLAEATKRPVADLVSHLKHPSADVSPDVTQVHNAIEERNASNLALQRQLAALNQQLDDKIRNENQLSNELDTAVAYIQQKQADQAEWNSIRHSYESEIIQLKTQLENAADQIRRRPAQISETHSPSSLRQTNSAMNYLELYLKARSFRKALIWQKKYLMLTIQGYKDILRASGIHYDPDLLQKEIVIAPSSVGLADRTKPLTRFKIVAKAIVAIIRMRYMVSRWKSKSTKTSVSNSHEDSPAGIASRAAVTPPTKDNKSSAGTSITTIPLRRGEPSQTRRRSSVNPRFPNAHTNPIEFSNAPSSSNVPRPTASGSGGTVLSQYLDRFEYLENQLGSSLGRETNRPPEPDHDE